MKAIIDRPPPNENAPTTKKNDPTSMRLGVCAPVLELVIAGTVIDHGAKCTIDIQATTTATIANPALREWKTNTPTPAASASNATMPIPLSAASAAAAHAISSCSIVFTADCP